MRNLSSAFSNKTVLVTGHTGFKGSWLAFMLRQLGAKVVGLSISEPEDGRHSYHALGVRESLLNAGDFLGDVRDIGAYERVVAEYRPDFIFHLAAQAIVSTSYVDPLTTFSTNVMGVVNALEVVRRRDADVTALIITSDKCYKNKERMEPYGEGEEMGGDDPYSASKGAAELAFHAYFNSYFRSSPNKSLASTRAGNVFGGGDWSANRLVPDCMRDLAATGEISIRMPEAIRPWTFVVDILTGYLLLAASLSTRDQAYRGSWNFASNETRTVEEICRLIIQAAGHGALKVQRAVTIGKEAGLLLIDPNKAKTALGWQPVASIDESIGDTVRWYLEQERGVDMAGWSERYLAGYFDRAGVS